MDHGEVIILSSGSESSDDDDVMVVNDDVMVVNDDVMVVNDDEAAGPSVCNIPTKNSAAKNSVFVRKRSFSTADFFSSDDENDEKDDFLVDSSSISDSSLNSTTIFSSNFFQKRKKEIDLLKEEYGNDENGWGLKITLSKNSGQNFFSTKNFLKPDVFSTNSADENVFSTNQKKFPTSENVFSTNRNHFLADPDVFLTGPDVFSSNQNVFSTNQKNVLTNENDFSADPDVFLADPDVFLAGPDVFLASPDVFSTVSAISVSVLPMLNCESDPNDSFGIVFLRGAEIPQQNYYPGFRCFPPIRVRVELSATSNTAQFFVNCSWLVKDHMKRLNKELQRRFIKHNGSLSSVLSWLSKKSIKFLGILHHRRIFYVSPDVSQKKHYHIIFHDFESVLKLFSDLKTKLISFEGTILNIFESLERKNSFECAVCFEKKPTMTAVLFPKCKHFFCRFCVSEHLSIKVREGQLKDLTCLEGGCKVQANVEVEDFSSWIKQFVDGETFQRYCDLTTDQFVDESKMIIRCPKNECNAPMELIPNAQRELSCLTCHHKFCSTCKAAPHPNMPCLTDDQKKQIREEWKSADEAGKKALEQRVGPDNVKFALEDAESEEWISKNAKPCPKCSTPIQKIDGCNKMVCTSRGCRTFFCWLCLTALPQNDPYKHFSEPGGACAGLLHQAVQTVPPWGGHDGAFPPGDMLMMDIQGAIGRIYPNPNQRPPPLPRARPRPRPRRAQADVPLQQVAQPAHQRAQQAHQRAEQAQQQAHQRVQEAQQHALQRAQLAQQHAQQRAQLAHQRAQQAQQRAQQAQQEARMTRAVARLQVTQAPPPLPPPPPLPLLLPPADAGVGPQNPFGGAAFRLAHPAPFDPFLWAGLADVPANGNYYGQMLGQGAHGGHNPYAEQWEPLQYQQQNFDFLDENGVFPYGEVAPPVVQNRNQHQHQQVAVAVAPVVQDRNRHQQVAPPVVQNRNRNQHQQVAVAVAVAPAYPGPGDQQMQYMHDFLNAEFALF